MEFGFFILLLGGRNLTKKSRLHFPYLVIFSGMHAQEDFNENAGGIFPRPVRC